MSAVSLVALKVWIMVESLAAPMVEPMVDQ
jgi:hypothetical protein